MAMINTIYDTINHVRVDGFERGVRECEAHIFILETARCTATLPFRLKTMLMWLAIQCGPAGIALLKRGIDVFIETEKKLDDAPEEYIQMMLRAIVGIEIEVTSLTGKFKLSQNRPPEDYAAVVDTLEKSPAEVLQAMRSYMKPN